MKQSPPNSCNVLSLGTEKRHLWRFSTGGGQANLTAEQNGSVVAPLPQKYIRKDWRALVVRKLNIAWLPLDQVFLRVIQLPKCDHTELLSMLEFQLEKLSPLPVAQIVWSAEVIPSHTTAPSELQTVLVIIVARDQVEAFLGELEGKGFLADQLEVPCLNQLLATKIDADGAWIYVIPFGGKLLAMTAWWYGGVLQTLSLMHLSGPENFAAEIGEQLTKTAWAGELEGWMTSPPAWRLVADSSLAGPWTEAFSAWAGKPVEIERSLTEAESAKLSAQRVARGESKVNLLPSEYAVRYRQQLIDRVWMRGLGALVLLYIVGVLAYLGAVNYFQIQKGLLEKEVTKLNDAYTQALKEKARIEVVKNQIALKFAALNVWQAVTRELPEELVLTSLAFTRGKTISLDGIASEAAKVTDYFEALKRIQFNDGDMFSKIDIRPTRTGPGPLGQGTVFWGFECEMRNMEPQ